MQHKAVLRFAEHLQPHYHGHYGADTADKEHIYVQRDAPITVRRKPVIYQYMGSA